MRISLYSESPDPGPGGAEQFIAVLAEALSARHEVVIVHHKPETIAQALPVYSGCDLSRVEFRRVAMPADESASWRSFRERYRAACAWRREVTAECDLFIGLLHNKPPFCLAKKGVMVVLFPTYQIPPPPPPVPPKKKKRGAKKERRNLLAGMMAQSLYARFEWNRRMASYPIKLAISDFSQSWTKTRWGVETDLLYPPVDVPAEVHQADKKNLILSVGRFATTGHTKKQLELIGAFRQLGGELAGWSYSSVGGLNETTPDHEYFAAAQALGRESGVTVAANIDHAELSRLYREARIFWHAAGLGDDHAARPEQAEHFGLTTVEAMAHGCVPLVINHGGQPEIVEHGVSGFVWETLEQLRDHTRRLARDPQLLASMARAARKRAESFSRERCLQKLQQLAGIE